MNGSCICPNHTLGPAPRTRLAQPFAKFPGARPRLSLSAADPPRAHLQLTDSLTHNWPVLILETNFHLCLHTRTETEDPRKWIMRDTCTHSRLSKRISLIVLVALVAFGLSQRFFVIPFAAAWLGLTPKAKMDEVHTTEQAISDAVRLAPEFQSAAFSSTNDLQECARRWQMKAPRDGWGKPLAIVVRNFSPFEFRISAMGPYPQLLIIEFDSRFPEKGIQKYPF